MTDLLPGATGLLVLADGTVLRGDQPEVDTNFLCLRVLR
jgi:hypothetical protein